MKKKDKIIIYQKERVLLSDGYEEGLFVNPIFYPDEIAEELFFEYLRLCVNFNKPSYGGVRTFFTENVSHILQFNAGRFVVVGNDIAENVYVFRINSGEIELVN